MAHKIIEKTQKKQLPCVVVIKIYCFAVLPIKSGTLRYMKKAKNMQ